MSGLVLGANVISMDEACWSLKEIIGPSPDSKSVRRWQIITVLRNDRLAEMRHDLGPASSFKCDEFVIPGGVYDPTTGRGELLETVGELVDIADRLRGAVYRPPQRPGADLIGQYRDLPDRRRRERRKLSLFSRQTKVQRD